jgi:hypothetical protein
VRALDPRGNSIDTG